MTTKRDIIDRARTEIGMGPYAFDLTPEQGQEALSTLDMMMAAWAGQNLNLRYILGSTDLADDIGSPDWAHSAIVTNLAVWLASRFGRTVQPGTQMAAAAGMIVVRNKCMMVPSGTADTMMAPAGAGAKTPWSGPFLTPETDVTTDTFDQDVGN